MRVAGIMSGTSLDGIDVAVADITGKAIKVAAHRTTPYPAKVRFRLAAISNANTHTAEISRLNFLLPQLYASAVRNCGVPLETIELVGCHGQTIFHERNSTLQIGDGSVLAELLGVPVVSDFRPRDMAAGGHGAPLVPFVDYRLYRHAKLGRVALNVGGIANLTAIPAKAQPADVIAFDTGPGNMVVDQLMERYTEGKKRYDRGGQIARTGTLDRKLLGRLLADRYFLQAPPKTAGREQYGQAFVDSLVRTGLSFPGLIATATAFTAASIAQGMQRWVPFPCDELIVSGGGSHNQQLLAYLAGFLPETELRFSSDFGYDVDAKEAIAFAVLAYETWHGRPSNLPAATGARKAVVLGKISR